MPHDRQLARVGQCPNPSTTILYRRGLFIHMDTSTNTQRIHEMPRVHCIYTAIAEVMVPFGVWANARFRARFCAEACSLKRKDGRREYGVLDGS